MAPSPTTCPVSLAIPTGPVTPSGIVAWVKSCAKTPPIAATVDDARAIAQAAKAAGKVNFQCGLQARSDPQNHFLLVNHVRAASYGKPVMARSQWHKKQSWRRASPNPEREKAVNWRLNKEISTGLIGELGIHQLDLITWFLNQRPAGVSGLGGILNWNDGRDAALVCRVLGTE